MEISVELKSSLAKLKSEYEKEICDRIEAEAIKNNPYKIGDVLEDHYQIGKVTEIRYSIGILNYTYNIVYICDKLNKKLLPYRGGEITTIYLFNVKKKLN